MGKRLRELEADRLREERKAARWAAENGIGSMPSDDSTRVGGGSSRHEPGLPRQHRDTVSYSQFGTMDAWENWMLDEGAGYTPLVGGHGGPLTAEQWEERARVENVLSFLREDQAQLLNDIVVGRRTEQEVADELSITQQAVSKRLKAAKLAFATAYAEHYDDEVVVEELTELAAELEREELMS